MSFWSGVRVGGLDGDALAGGLLMAALFWVSIGIAMEATQALSSLSLNSSLAAVKSRGPRPVAEGSTKVSSGRSESPGFEDRQDQLGGENHPGRIKAGSADTDAR